MRRRSCVPEPGVALVLLAACAALGQAPDPAPRPETAQSSDPVVTFHANANLVLIDVVVRQKGAPVLGLTQQAFHVREDGKDQKISVFEEHRAGDVLEAVKKPNLPPHTYSDDPQYTRTSATNVLLLDALNTPLADQMDARKEMLSYLGAIPKGTDIAVFSLASQLRMITGFTTNVAEIANALNPGRGGPEGSSLLDPDFDSALDLQATLNQSVGLPSASVTAMQQFVDDTKNFEVGLREEMAIGALNQIARYLSTIPGRKNLIWFSAAFPLRFLEGGENPNMDPATDYAGMVRRTAELLTLARVAVYPVDSRGLLSMPSTHTDFAGISHFVGTSESSAGAGNGRVGSFAIDQQPTTAGGGGFSSQLLGKDQTFMNDLTWDHFNMDQIAEETGGEAFYNRNDLGAVVGEAVANGASYYTLGYSPRDLSSSRALRTIDVRLDGGRYGLEYRHAYYAVAPAVARKWLPGSTSPLADAMLHGSLPLSQVMYQVRVLPEGDPALQGATAVEKRSGFAASRLQHPQHYLVDYRVNLSGVDAQKLPNGKIHREIELTQVAYTVEGFRENYTDAAFSVDLTPGQDRIALRDGIQMHQEIDIPEGNNYLRIGVHDVLSGRIGTVEIALAVPKSQIAAR
ncbi:MAG TPA: VWA domain-containing protein [Acidobacteriaceae bacterium]|nr:VWA domain-containing protein [Acidobacteriaceae bacterium]